MKTRQVFTAYDRRGPKAPRFRYCPYCASRLTVPAGKGKRPSCPSCGFVEYRNPLPGVVVLVEREGQVLLGRRSTGGYGAGKWCLPGGFVEFEEDFLSAGIREVREETGLRIGVKSILSVVTNFLSPRLHTLVVVLLAEVLSGTAEAVSELVELGWFPLAGPLPELAFEADGHIIRRYHATGLSGAPVDPACAGQGAPAAGGREP
jgi:8-oxo-dGTP diphosphatase